MSYYTEIPYIWYRNLQQIHYNYTTITITTRTKKMAKRRDLQETVFADAGGQFEVSCGGLAVDAEVTAPCWVSIVFPPVVWEVGEVEVGGAVVEAAVLVGRKIIRRQSEFGAAKVRGCHSKLCKGSLLWFSLSCMVYSFGRSEPQVKAAAKRF